MHRGIGSSLYLYNAPLPPMCHREVIPPSVVFGVPNRLKNFAVLHYTSVQVTTIKQSHCFGYTEPPCILQQDLLESGLGQSATLLCGHLTVLKNQLVNEQHISSRLNSFIDRVHDLPATLPKLISTSSEINPDIRVLRYTVALGELLCILHHILLANPQSLERW